MNFFELEPEGGWNALPIINAEKRSREGLTDFDETACSTMDDEMSRWLCWYWEAMR